MYISRHIPLNRFIHQVLSCKDGVQIYNDEYDTHMNSMVGTYVDGI